MSIHFSTKGKKLWSTTCSRRTPTR
jgi:hypothetical protein